MSINVRFRQQKKEKQFTFHWRGGYLTREVFGELLEQISAAGRERGKSARVSVNWQQAVLRFDYVEAGQRAGGACCDGRSK